jgi:hypothetical protein
VLRSGAYSDEVVMNLIRRRFVATWYDVAEPGVNAGDAWAYDPDAAAAFGSAPRKPPRGKRGGGSQGTDGRVRADSYPAALFLTPEGELLGPGLWGILSPEAMVAALQALIAAHPERFAPGDDEAQIVAAADARPDDVAAQFAAARLAWELAEFEACLRRADAGLRAAGAGVAAAELHWLRGRALLCLHQTAEARTALGAAAAAASPGERLDAARFALAMAAIQDGAHEDALARCMALVAEGDDAWRGAAMYYAGLCHWRLGRRDEAKALWRRHRAELPWDRLARRSAASLGVPEAQAFRNQELLETKGWW